MYSPTTEKFVSFPYKQNQLYLKHGHSYYICTLFKILNDERPNKMRNNEL